MTLEELLETVCARAAERLDEKRKMIEQFDPALFERIKRVHILRTIDELWKDHLYDMDCLREGINLRAYGQKDPLIEYKKEGFEMFQSMLDRIEEDAVRYLFLIQPVVDQPAPVRRQTPVYYQQPAGPSGQRSKQARAMIPGKRHKH